MILCGCPILYRLGVLIFCYKVKGTYLLPLIFDHTYNVL